MSTGTTTRIATPGFAHESNTFAPMAASFAIADPPLVINIMRQGTDDEPMASLLRRVPMFPFEPDAAR